MKNKALEEATVRVLPDCTGSILGSEIGDGVLPYNISTRASFQLHNNSEDQLCDLLSRSGVNER